MKNLIILGSTGSIGTQTLDVVRTLNARRRTSGAAGSGGAGGSGKSGGFRVLGLTCRSNIDLLEQQIREFNPQFVSVADVEAARQMRKKKLKCEFRPGTADFVKVLEGGSAELLHALADADIVVAAMSGTDGIPLVKAALKAGKKVALANKEALVCGGQEIMGLADSLPGQSPGQRCGADIGAGGFQAGQLLPIDSEHSAVWQCIEQARLDGTSTEIESITLTASGGPFFGFTKEQLRSVTLEQALNHPTWKMGPEISINSATLMNKAFEIIEARWLFFAHLPDATDWENKIKVKIERTSHVHAYVRFADGRILAQVSPPDMREPIRYALQYPTLLPQNIINFNPEKNDFKLIEPDFETFAGPIKAYEALKAGTQACKNLYESNKEAVRGFIAQGGVLPLA